MNVSLGADLEEVIRQKVAGGRYNSASEVVREAIRLPEAYDKVRDRALESLRRDVEAGWEDAEAGRISEFDPADIKRRGRERLARKGEDV
jgi:antitoxin ParD1/3/4